jgi:hypothetical protein
MYVSYVLLSTRSFFPFSLLVPAMRASVCVCVCVYLCIHVCMCVIDYLCGFSFHIYIYI